MSVFEKQKRIDSRFTPDADLVLYHGDVVDFLSALPDNTVRLIGWWRLVVKQEAVKD